MESLSSGEPDRPGYLPPETPIPFSIADRAEQVWTIGGRYPLVSQYWGQVETGYGFTGFEQRPTGYSLKPTIAPITLDGTFESPFTFTQNLNDCCIDEFWNAPGQYLDWNNPDIREKFHKSDDQGKFSPVSLGDDGALPTGAPPLLYCHGGPDKFFVNHATGLNPMTQQNGTPMIVSGRLKTCN